MDFNFFSTIVFSALLIPDGYYNDEPLYKEQYAIAYHILHDMQMTNHPDWMDVCHGGACYHLRRLKEHIRKTYDAPSLNAGAFLPDATFSNSRMQILTEYKYYLGVKKVGYPSKRDDITELENKVNYYIRVYQSIHHYQIHLYNVEKREILKQYKELVGDEYFYNGFPHYKVLEVFQR